jgi:hypothetical protein
MTDQASAAALARRTRRQWLARRTLRVLAVQPVLAGLLTAGMSGGASASTCVNWTGSQPPNPSSVRNGLQGVAVLSSCNAWAVGYYNGTARQTLVEHWNGTAWRQVRSPNPGGPARDNVFEGVAATSARNIWAAGFDSNGTAYQTLIEHWNGTAWRKVRSPNPGGSANSHGLFGVAAVSAANAWAVGDYSNGTADRTLVEHWNGRSWKQMPSPNLGSSANGNLLLGVAATSSRNAWAVGDYSTGAGVHTLVLHWNGRRWRHVPSPDPGGSATFNELFSVAAVSATSAWAVGVSGSRTLILHWNGTAWKRVPSPDLGGPADDNVLSGVVATSSRNAWAVGNFLSQSLVLHWNGTSWRHVPSPNAGLVNELFGVAAASSANIWAVGFYDDGVSFKSLAIHCC